MSYFQGPSAKALQEKLALSQADASLLKDLMNGSVNPVKVAEEMGLLKGFHNDPEPDHAIMLIANVMLKGHGEEAVEGEYVDSYHQNFQIDYINMGDTYSTTLILDNVTKKFLIGSWGDFVESHPKRFPASNPPAGNPMKLHPPFEISARLLPAVRIGDSWISIEFGKQTSDGRIRYKYYIDTPKFKYENDDLKSGVGGGDLQSGMASLLSFLGACAEARTGRRGENADLFPERVGAWAKENQDEIDMLAIELEEKDNLLEASNPPEDEEDDFDLKQEMADGYVISDVRGGYSVVGSGKYLGKFFDLKVALRISARDMEKHQYFPNVFYVNDHGNVDQLAFRVTKFGHVSGPKIIRSWV